MGCPVQQRAVDSCLDDLRKFDGHPIGGDFQALFARSSQRGRQRKITAYQLGIMPGALELRCASGERGAIVTPDSCVPGAWRATFYDGTGFSGHRESSCKLDLMEGLLADGFTYSEPGHLRRAHALWPVADRSCGLSPCKFDDGAVADETNDHDGMHHY